MCCILIVSDVTYAAPSVPYGHVIAKRQIHEDIDAEPYFVPRYVIEPRHPYGHAITKRQSQEDYDYAC